MKIKNIILIIISIGIFAVGAIIFIYISLMKRQSALSVFNDRVTEEARSAMPTIRHDSGSAVRSSGGRVEVVILGTVSDSDRLLKLQPISDCGNDCSNWTHDTSEIPDSSPKIDEMSGEARRELASIKKNPDTQCVTKFAPNENMGGTAPTKFSNRDILCISKKSGRFAYILQEL
jgi:hypothetical protein